MSERLGQYVLEKRIGAGGMADVFLARGPQGVCVVKRPHPHLCANPDFVRMFLDEASLLAQLHHPNIAQISDLGQVGKTYFLAMEYVPGFDLMTISLEHERQGELMQPQLCARIVADAAGALHYAHEAVGKSGPLNIVHRDVSPHNILLSMTGMVKLIDFGVARASSATHRTQAGLVKGKYPYMSPEQITGQEIDRRVDIYALGLVLYELLTNTRAIAGETEIEQIDNARASRIRPIEQLRPNVPEPIKQILGGCLHPLVEGRYPTAKHLKDDLERYLQYERHVVGQEDLLRLFRVVAAEVSHLETLTDPNNAKADSFVSDDTLEPSKRTELEVPSSETRVPEAPLPEVGELGFARTQPSMPHPKVEPTPGSAAPTAPLQLTQPVTARSAAENAASPTASMPVGPAPADDPKLKATFVLPPRPPTSLEPELKVPKRPMGLIVGGLVVLALAAGAAVLATRGDTVTAVDAGVALALVDAGVVGVIPLEPLPPPPEVAVVEDAGTEEPAAEPQDAGEPAPAEDNRIATLKVRADVPGALLVDGKPAKPGTLELAAGKHLIGLINPAENLRYFANVTLTPGQEQTLVIAPKKGTLELSIRPFGRIALAGKELAPGVSFKQLDLYEGSYMFDIQVPGAPKSAKKVKVQVVAGVVTRQEVVLDVE